MIGLGIPPLAAGLYQSERPSYMMAFLTSEQLLLGFQPHVRESIPQFSVLLQNYATLFLPVVFALLVGINMQVWRVSRINWIFIFGLLFL
jgi:xenotropic and polytropic retrovirus receptor 1